MKKNLIINQDNITYLKTLPENSIDCCVTDPPYGLKFMNKHWDYDVPGVELWKEVYRVLKPGAHLLSFGGTRTYHRMASAIEDAGFEIRDQLQWLYGSGFPKSKDLGKEIDKMNNNKRVVVGSGKMGSNNTTSLGKYNLEKYNITKGESFAEGWGTNLKPANEPIVLARKPISEKTIALNFQKWGTGGINIEACRVPIKDGAKMGRENKEGAKGLYGGTIGSGPDNATKYGEPSGRWPANVILTHHPECKFKEKKIINENKKPVNYQIENKITDNIPFKRSKKKNINNFIKEEIELYDCHPDCPYNFFPPSTGIGSFPKATGKKNNFFPGYEAIRDETIYLNDQGSTARFFYCAKASKKEKENTTHPTVKPVELMKYLIKLVCPPGGIVLDPFAGTSTTAVAAKELGINYIMIEKEKEYYDFSKERLK